MIRRRMAHRRFWVWIFPSLMFAAPFLILGWYVLSTRSAYARLADKLPEDLEKARAAGLPITARDMAALVACRPSDDAAPDYWRAFSVLNATPVPKAFWTELDDWMLRTASPAAQADVRKTLAGYSKLFAFVQRAGSKAGLDWKADWNNPLDTFSPTSKLKEVAKLLCAKAEVGAKDGRMAEAWRLLSVAAKVETHAAFEPSLFGELIQNSIDARILVSVHRLVAARRDRATLDEAARFVASLPPLPSLRRAMSGEMYRCMWVARNGDRLDLTPDLRTAILIRDPTFRKAWEVSTIEYWMRVIDSVGDGRDWRDVRDDQVRLSKQAEEDPLFKPVNPITAPLFSQAMVPNVRSLARRRALAMAIRVFAMEERDGRLPVALPSVGPGGIDPFDSKPLRYRLTAGGFEVYSVDSDLQDDDGLTSAGDERGRSKTHDIGEGFAIYPSAH